jgi:hypothetical protein
MYFLLVDFILAVSALPVVIGHDSLLECGHSLDGLPPDKLLLPQVDE